MLYSTTTGTYACVGWYYKARVARGVECTKKKVKVVHYLYILNILFNDMQLDNAGISSLVEYPPLT